MFIFLESDIDKKGIFPWRLNNRKGLYLGQVQIAIAHYIEHGGQTAAFMVGHEKYGSLTNFILRNYLVFCAYNDKTGRVVFDSLNPFRYDLQIIEIGGNLGCYCRNMFQLQLLDALCRFCSIDILDHFYMGIITEKLLALQ